MPLLSNSHPHSSCSRVHFAENDDNEDKSRGHGHLSRNENGNGDNTNDGGDNDDKKTPDRDEVRQDHTLPPLPIKKVALPIVRSKIDQHEAQFLLGVDDKKFQSTKTLKVTNGSLSSHHNNNLHEISDAANSASKIPKSLKNLVVREKIHPNVNPGRRKDPTKSSSKSPTRVNAIDLSNKNPYNTKIVVSRGVEMKRVDGKSDHISQPPVSTYGSSSCNNNIKPRTATTTRKQASSSTAESSSSKNLKRKSVTIEPSSLRPAKSKGKPSTVVVTPSSQNESAPLATTGAGEGHPGIVLAESYKTLKEFLNLPPVIPVSNDKKDDSQQQQEEDKAITEPPPTKSKPTANSYYKSKFWEYVDPNKKAPSSKPPEKPKAYDPTAVKSFIEKQKESRREKETADLKAKQEQLDKKKKHLALLKEKCRHLVVGSGKTPPTTTSLTATTSTKGLKTSTTTTSGDDAYNFIRKDVLEQVLQKVATGSAPPSSEIKVIHHKPPPPPRVQYHSVRPVIKSPHRPPQPQRRLPMSSPSSRTITNTTTSSAAVSRSSILLQEFETIVKRECINFFQTKHVATETMPQPSLPPPPSSSVEKRFSEKCVATTASLGELEKSNNIFSSKSSILSDNSSIISVKLRTMHDYDAAASKIQAAFKGYKERKILKEANILPRDLLRVKKMLALKRPVGIGGSGFKMSSFSSKMPEKPYDQESPSSSYSDYLKQKLGKNESKIRHVSPTVTPHAPARPTSSSSSRKSFNEPYPTEAIQRLQQEAQVAAVSRRNSLSELRKCVMLPETRPRPNLDASLLDTTLTPKNSSTGLLNLRRKSESLGLGIGQPAPSISAVLFEKLKGLQSERDAITTRKSVSAIHLTPPAVDDDFESISSIAHPHDSQDVSITDDYFGPSDSEMHHPRTLTSTPLKLLSETSLHQSQEQKHHRIHHGPRKSKSPKSPSSREDESASTTTVETDVELGPGQGHPTTTVTTSTTPGQPSSTSALPMPAMTLRYHAERERLNILEKAIQAATLYEKRHDRVAPPPVQAPPPPQPPVKVPTTSEIESIAKKVAEDRIKVNLAELEKEKWSNLIKQQESTQQTSSLNNLALEVMKCQQEAAAATAEVSKMMMQVGKSVLEDRQQERIFQENRIHQQQLQARISDDPVNMAAIVVAAVDEAQRIVERERQHREALSRVTRRPHQRGEEFQRVEEQEASEKQIFRFSTPSHQDVALQFPSFSSSSETPSVVGVGDDEQLEKELNQGDELSLDHLQSFVDDQPDNRFEQESSEVEMIKSVTQLSEQNNYHTSQNETPSKIEVVEDSFTSKPADDKTEESIGFEASFLSEEKEPTEEQGTESSIPEVADVDEDNKTESPLAISHIEEEEEQEIFENSKVESVSEVKAEVGTNISIGEFSRSKEEDDHDHDLASFMSDMQQSEGHDEMDKKHGSQMDDHENDFIYSGTVEEEEQKGIISSPTIEQFLVLDDSPGRLEGMEEEDDDEGKIVKISQPPFTKEHEEPERSESNIPILNDEIVPTKESEDIPLLSIQHSSLSPPPPEEAVHSVVINQTIESENVATSSPLEPGNVHKDESAPSAVEEDNNNNPESILESIGYDVDSDVGADIDISSNADRDLSNQSGQLIPSGDDENGVINDDDDGKKKPTIKTPSPPPSPLSIHDHKEEGAVTPPDTAQSDLNIDQLPQQMLVKVTIDNGKDNSENETMNENSPIVVTLETELVKDSEELSAQQQLPPPQDFSSLLSDPENKDVNSSLLSEVSDKYSESFLSDKEGDEEEADSEPRFEEEGDNDESESRAGSKNSYQEERDQSPEKDLILSPIVDSTPEEDSATSPTKDEFGEEDEKGSPRTTEMDPPQIPITTTTTLTLTPATTITTTFPETQSVPQPPPPPEPLEDKSELFQLVTQQRQRVEDEIRELEAQISTSPSDAIDDYLSALKQEGGDARIITCPRPPPPYPPVDSVLSTLHRHIDENRMEDPELIHRVVAEEVDRVWDEYVRTGNIKIEEQVVADVEEEKEEEDLEGDDFEIGDDIDASNMELFANYIRDNTVALTHLVRETIRSTLSIPELKTPVGFVDTCRRGVYALEAKEFKVPKTKEALIAAVERAIAPIPLEPKQVNGEKPQVLKNLTTHATWTCRPMDVVENILVPEIIQDELNWVNAWPEALLLQEECKDKIVAACLKDVLQNFEQAFKNC